MILLEIFNSSLEYEKTFSCSDKVRYGFLTPSGISKSRLIQVVFETSAQVADSWDLSFTSNGKSDITGGGNAEVIFSTVMKIVEDFVKEHHPKVLMFMAAKVEPSRIKLYQRIVTRQIGRIGFETVDQEVPKKDLPSDLLAYIEGKKNQRSYNHEFILVKKR